MSVRERKWTTKSGEVRKCYLVQYSTAELDKRGKRTRRCKQFRTKKAADLYEAQVRVHVEAGTHVPPSKSVTVSAAGNLWLDSCDGLEPATVDSYRNHLNLHIRPYLGGMRLSALSVAAVRGWQDALRKGVAAPGQANGKARSADMVRRATISLGALIADAQERGLVATNVVRSMKAAHKRGKARQQERRAKGKLQVGEDIPTSDEVDAILNAAKGRWRPFLLVAIRCGLRASELRGLRWQDIDFGRSVLHVRQRADKHNTIGPPKSETSARTVPIPPKTLQALREWKLVCPRREAGELLYVFPNGSGNIESHANVLHRGLEPTLIAAGVTKVVKGPEGKLVTKAKYTGLHALRHYFASWCANRKADGGCELPIKVVSARLGHSSIALTADLYTHLFPSSDDSAALAAAEGRFG
jgi:integrase